MSYNKDEFNFSKWINNSFLEVAKKAIKVVEKKQSTDSYSFYITFITADKNVILSESLLQQYPEIMTIVLENQFENLKTDSKGFFVTLSFKGVATELYIPWNSMISFVEKKLDLQMLFNYVPNFKTKSKEKLITTTLPDSLDNTAKSSKKSRTKSSKNINDNSNVIDFKSLKNPDEI